MLPLQSGSLTSLSVDSKKHIADSAEFREYLLQFAKEADFNISDIKVQKMTALFGHKVETEDGTHNYILPESCQSTGTKRMVEVESMIYEQLNRQAFLCIDEIEASMHPNFARHTFYLYRQVFPQTVGFWSYRPTLTDCSLTEAHRMINFSFHDEWPQNPLFAGL